MARPSESIVIKDINGDDRKISEYEATNVAISRLKELAGLIKKQINLLTKKEISYIIITGGTAELPGMSYLVEEIFGSNAKVGNIDTIGIRNNKYSTVSGLIKGINDKLESRDKEYTMIDLDNDASGQNKLSINDSSVLNKVFGYFFDN